MKYKQSWEEGTAAEQAYITSLENEGYIYIRHATPTEDRQDHWDLMFKDPDVGVTFTTDVKAQRHKYRGGPLLEDFLVIEWKNVAGKEGWILGKAYEIAYEYLDNFYVFNRKELMNYAFMVTDFCKIVTKFSDCVHGIYQRKDRKDQMTLLKLSDLLLSIDYGIYPKLT
jgi:hypothetical protein